MRPIEFVLSETDEVLVSQSGLALVGAILAPTNMPKRVNRLRLGDRRRPKIAHSDVLRSMIGLLCLGKSDFEAITAFAEDDFFRLSLGLKEVPSEPTLRQRLDELGTACDEILREEAAEMIARHAPALSPCYEDWIALDADVSPFDNSGTKKEGVSRTYHQVDGYAPVFAYLAEEGYQINCQLRQGSQHCQSGMPEFLGQSITLARRITDARLLLRLDAGHDDMENVRVCRRSDRVDWIIKRNLRQESIEDWLVEAQAYGVWSEPRPGKEVYVGETWRQRDGHSERVVFEVIQRTTTAQGQKLLVPDTEVHTFWTSLKLSPETVIELYRQHGTSEQFHSEIKSDLGLERLPSGKFTTNALVLLLGLWAYNILRLCGQNMLNENRRAPKRHQMPVRKPVARRRLRSVIQDLIYLAARFTQHAHRVGLSFYRATPWHGLWHRVYRRIASTFAPSG